MSKVVIYQALARLWGKGRFESWDEATLIFLKSMGVDYLYLVGIPRHASGKDFVKGDPGCPYSVSDWYGVNEYMGTMEEFCALVHRVHSFGLKLMIDYIPNHVARDYEGNIVHFDYCDADWSDTLKNDWSSTQTRAEMLNILKYWAGLGVDGFRCDMVELVPANYLGALINELKLEFPSLLFVAEVYGRENYRRYLSDGAFDLLYDKSGLYDSLILLASAASYSSARAITRNWQSLGDIQDRMLCFLENHDEPRIVRLLGNSRRSLPLLAVSLLFNNSSFMLYFGGEVGENAVESENARTSIFSWCKPKGISALYDYIHSFSELSIEEKELLDKYKNILLLSKQPAFNANNWDLVYCNEDRLNPDTQFAFIRYDESSTYLVFCNFSSEYCSSCLRIPSELQALCSCSEVSISCGGNDFAVLEV